MGTEAEITAVGGGDATLIDWRERDHSLDLHSSGWGGELTAPWEASEEPGHFFMRRLRVSDTPEMKIGEYIVRFPSVPIFGINRKADYKIQIPKKPNLHTLRVLADADREGPITRMFILCNGLNETRNLRFYYRLASWILREDADCGHRSACLIAPFPGHLMHAPFTGPFAQSPLARYLADSGELFRQFLRYMIEMRWLLSLLMKRRPESWRVGGRPLKRSSLPSTVFRQWSELRHASLEIWRGRRADELLDEETERRLLGEEIDEEAVTTCVAALREVLGLDDAESPLRMPVHTVGYSLGGFLAQSVFFAWPNIISSCATICSGGAIRALSPTAFAHSEEWQAVLHTLRPELEESMLSRRISREVNRIAGVEQDQFGYYQRIFDQVFLQDDNASYKARISEYGTRLLFISGGEDPIVKTREILDASPDEGITMLSVASLTHFLGEEPLTDREVEQREFWLPEAGGLLGRSAKRAEELHEHERRDSRQEYLAATRYRNDQPKESDEEKAAPKRPRQRDLASPEFEDALDWVIDGVSCRDDLSGKLGKGWLLICRSGIPAAFLGSEMHRAWGAGLHHHDVNIQKYATGLARRASSLAGIEPRTTLVLPSGLQRTFVESSGGLVDPHSDAPGYLTTGQEREEAWNEFKKRWGSRLRWLHPGPVSAVPAGDVGRVPEGFAKAVSAWQDIPPSQLKVANLPDVWISVDNVRPSGFDPGQAGDVIHHFAKWVGDIVSGEPAVSHQGPGSRSAKGENGKALEEDLATGRVRIVRVSGAELNPRYRGRLEQSFWPCVTLLAHCAAALLRSGSEPEQ